MSSALSASRGCIRLLPKTRDPVKCQEVRIVLIVGASLFVVIGSSGDEEDVSAVEQPVDVLKRVLFRIGMVEYGRADRPVAEIS